MDGPTNLLTNTEIENQEDKKKHEEKIYADVFKIGTDGLIIPFEKLDEVTNLKSVDLTYY